MHAIAAIASPPIPARTRKSQIFLSVSLRLNCAHKYSWFLTERDDTVSSKPRAWGRSGGVFTGVTSCNLRPQLPGTALGARNIIEYLFKGILKVFEPGNGLGLKLGGCVLGLSIVYNGLSINYVRHTFIVDPLSPCDVFGAPV